MAFCTKCGFQNPDGALFCGQCGQKQGEAVAMQTMPMQQQFSAPASDNSLGVVTVVVSIFIPILFPLIMWLTQREQNKQVGDTSKEVLNFQISSMVFFIIVMIALSVLAFVGGWISLGIGFFIGMTLMGLFNFVFGVGYLILMIIAAVKASKNEPYRFPFTVRLIR